MTTLRSNGPKGHNSFFTDRYSSIGSIEDSKATNNPRTTANTSDQDRSDLLLDYIEAIEGVAPTVELMPLGEDKQPIIEGRCSLDSDEARSLLNSPEEAAEAIREGHPGFALYAGKSEHGTENLCFTDRDDPEIWPLKDTPETVTVMSGSGRGWHETFLNGGVGNSKGKNDYDGAGEVRAKNWYVILPGSVHPSGGIYHTVSTTEVAELREEHLPKELQPGCQSDSDTAPKSIGGKPEAVDGIGEIEADFNIRRRLRKARDFEWGKKFIALWKGEYAEAGYDDHSDSEADLAEILGWIMKDDKEVVYQLMSIACRRHSKADVDGEKRKFARRGENYRRSTVEYGCSHDGDAYETGKGGFIPWEEKPEVSHVSKSKVYEALTLLGAARTTELVDHPEVDRGKDTVKRALGQYEEEGLVDSVRSTQDRRKRYYYIEGFESIIPPEKREVMDLD